MSFRVFSKKLLLFVALGRTIKTQALLITPILDLFFINWYYSWCAWRQNYILKVVARSAAFRTRSISLHANSHRICAFQAQKDSSGCGARRLAKIYYTLGYSNISTYTKKHPKAPGCFLFAIWVFIQIAFDLLSRVAQLCYLAEQLPLRCPLVVFHRLKRMTAYR